VTGEPRGEGSPGPGRAPRGARERLGVVVPMANEERTVDDFLRRVLAQLAEGDLVFCVLDLASRDSTMERVRRASGEDPRAILVYAPENRSVVDAYFRGYREALSAGCGWILEMDGGFSHLPEEIPRFVAAMASGVDFAAGSRFVRGGRYRGRLSRYAISRGGTLLANLLLGTRMKDMTSGFECFSRRAMARVVEAGVRSRGHFFQTEIRFLLRDWDWVEVPIRYSNPSRSVGAESVLDAIRNLWRLRRESRSG